MRILVDTPVWSLALRRTMANLGTGQIFQRRQLERLIEEGSVEIIGPIRQELLSGFRQQAQFERLREYLRRFEDARLVLEDYEEAAHIHNQCRAAGVSGSAVDFLICAVALRRDWQIFTLDGDFRRFARKVDISLYGV